MNEKDKAINDLVIQFKKDSYNSVYPNGWVAKDDSDVWYEANLWIFRKLAELQLEINELKNK